MRTLKFRAWHKEDKVMVYDLNTPGLVHSELKDRDNDSYIFMQFIGRADRKGKEIYEADILQQYDSFYNKDDGECVEKKQEKLLDKYVIEQEFRESCGCCSSIWGWDINDTARDEVIGNIYENTDLMDKKR